MFAKKFIKKVLLFLFNYTKLPNLKYKVIQLNFYKKVKKINKYKLSRIVIRHNILRLVN